MTVERTMQVAVSDLPDLSAAWAMVMEHVDEFDRPRITIEPISSSPDGRGWVDTYTVAISGQIKGAA